MEKEVNDRLLKFIKSNGYNINAFAAKIGVNPAVIHNIVKGRRTKPSCEVLNKIGLSFDNIDLNWLITGRKKSKLVLEESKEQYGVNGGKAVTKKVDELQKIVEKMAAEMEEMKKRME